MIQSSKTMLILMAVLLVNKSISASINKRFLEQAAPTVTPTETEQQIHEQIAALISQKQAIVANRSAILANLTAAGEAAKQLKLNLLDAKFGVEDAYRAYYNERLKCDGLDGKLSIVGLKSQISPDQCLQFPIPAEAVQLFTQLSQLQGFQADADIAQKAYDIQTGFPGDVQAQQAIYTDLTDYFKNKNNAELQNKFSNMAFTTGNTFYQQSQLAALKKQVLDGASANLNATNTAISASQAQLAPAVEQCNTNLAKLKADLDSKLEPLVKLQEDIKAQDDIIELAFKQLEDILGQLKNITVEMNNLATKYAQIISAQ